MSNMATRQRVIKRKFNITFRKRIADTGDKQFIHLQVGRAFENDDGHIDIILNSIPINPNWDGKLRAWVNREDEIEEDDNDLDEG